MAKYKLKKDVFFYKAGSICFLADEGCMVHDDSGNILLGISDIEEHPEVLDEWFEKIEEESMSKIEEVGILDDSEEQPLYKLSMEWSDIKGGYEYVLYQREIDGEALLAAWSMGWRPTVGPFHYKKIAVGDKDWAIRVTNHHGYAISSVITDEEKNKERKANHA